MESREIGGPIRRTRTPTLARTFPQPLSQFPGSWGREQSIHRKRGHHQSTTEPPVFRVGCLDDCSFWRPPTDRKRESGRPPDPSWSGRFFLKNSFPFSP